MLDLESDLAQLVTPIPNNQAETLVFSPPSPPSPKTTTVRMVRAQVTPEQAFRLAQTLTRRLFG